MDNENKGTFVCIDLDEWEPILQARGDDKGKHPLITNNGTVYADKSRVGEDVRLFVRKHK